MNQYTKSRLLYHRHIREIVHQNSHPFYISFDEDPYLVITDSGRLVWLLDGYTISDKYPYSESYNGQFNYIRNSVLVSIDAYDGTVNYYIKDPRDPIIQTYQQNFPNHFSTVFCYA